MPHECVDCAHGIAFLCRERYKCVVEVLRFPACNGPAFGVRRLNRLRFGQAIVPAGRIPGTSRPASACNNSIALRGLDMVGLAESTSYRRPSTARRISRPPRVNRSRSTASSRSTMPITLRPARTSLAYRPPVPAAARETAGVACLIRDCRLIHRAARIASCGR